MGDPVAIRSGKMNLNGPLHQVCILNFLILIRWRNIATNKDQYMSVRFCHFQRFSCEFSLPQNAAFGCLGSIVVIFLEWGNFADPVGSASICCVAQRRCRFCLGWSNLRLGWDEGRYCFDWIMCFFLGVSTKKRRTQNLDFPQNFHKIRSFLAGLVIFWWFWQDLCPPSILGVSSSWCIFWRVLSSSESSWYGFLSVGWNLARVTLVDKVW